VTSRFEPSEQRDSSDFQKGAKTGIHVFSVFETNGHRVMAVEGPAEIVAAMRPLSSSPRRCEKQITDYTHEQKNNRNERIKDKSRHAIKVVTNFTRRNESYKYEMNGK
jgi:hypothetical protein